LPLCVDSALWLTDKSNPPNGFLLLAGWCFIDRKWSPTAFADGSTSAVIDIVVTGPSGAESFLDLRTMETREDVNTEYPGSPVHCGFQFVLPTSGMPIGRKVDFRIKHKGVQVADYSVGNIQDASDPGKLADFLGIERPLIGKLENLLLNEQERLAQVIVKQSAPISLYIDPSFGCNLKCPHCISENLRAKRFMRPVLKEEMLEHILSVFGENIIKVTFALWGEPLLNTKLEQYVRRMKDHHIYVEMSTNLSVPLSDARIDHIMAAGFDAMRLSIDGATQENYEKYRVGGSLDLALGNLRRMAEAKRRLGLSAPELGWQFLIWPWNEHEVDAARTLANENGADSFRAFPGHPWKVDLQGRERLPEDDAVPVKDQLARRAADRRQDLRQNRHAVGCDFLDHTIAINSDGAIHPCCYVVEQKDTFGNVADCDRTNAFNLPPILNLRRFVKGLSHDSRNGPSPCANCDSLQSGHIPDQLGFFHALAILRQIRTAPVRVKNLEISVTGAHQP